MQIFFFNFFLVYINEILRPENSTTALLLFACVYFPGSWKFGCEFVQRIFSAAVIKDFYKYIVEND